MRRRFVAAVYSIILGIALTLSGAATSQTSSSVPASSAPAPTSAGNLRETPVQTQDSTRSAVATDPVKVPGCASPVQAPITTAKPVVLTLNPATSWQPPRGEVIMEATGDYNDLTGFAIRACFRWDVKDTKALYVDTPARIRGSEKAVTGIINFGIYVPRLSPAPESFISRVQPSGTLTFDGLGLIPVADMRLIVVSTKGVLADQVFHVGVTSPWWGLGVGLGSAIIALAIVAILAHARGTPGQGLLRLITTRDGTASLSSLQMLIWTVVVVFSAAYVMALSGNLIDVTPGTLVLLGIAGASSVAAALQPSRPVLIRRLSALQAELSVAQAAEEAVKREVERIRLSGQPIDAATHVRLEEAAGLVDSARDRLAQARDEISRKGPAWSDLIAPIDRSRGIDMTRVQMLVFTVVSAGFVLLKVLNTYVIPDIPDGYMVLMGISNGLYMGARASTIRSQAAPPGAATS